MRVGWATLALAGCRHTGDKAQRDAASTSAALIADSAALVALAGAGSTPVTHRDTDATGAGIVDGDLRPGTAASDPDSAATALSSDSVAPPTIPSPTGIPLVEGLRLTSALHFADGDRENLLTISTISNDGVVYRWRDREQHADGKRQEHFFSRLVSLNDLAGAPRLNPVFEQTDRSEHPGFTAMSLSRAAYVRASSNPEIPFTIVDLEAGPLGGQFVPFGSTLLTYKGTLARVAGPLEKMPVLLDGVRTELPTLHLHGHFSLAEKAIDAEFWFLADTANPLLLRSVTGRDVFQMIRIDRPRVATTTVEEELRKDCRAELPGLYFAFASADLEPESAPALAGVAAMLKRHPDWSLAIEGHTDSIGGAASNKALSERRAGAVRAALISAFGIDASRLRASGFGATRPKESNATLDGRARNRRVEVVRPCGTSH
jgi:flagellar motor protein MotB